MSPGRRAGWTLLGLVLALAAACATPSPSPTLVATTATPNGVQTAQALLTVSFASLTPSPSERPSQTISVSTATATQTLRVSETLRVSTGTATPGPTQPGALTATTAVLSTATLSGTATFSATATITPTLPARILPGNAVSVTQATVLGPYIITGTRLAKLDQAAWGPDGQLAAAGAAGLLFANTGALTVTRGYTLTAWATSVSFSPDGLALAAGSVDGTVRLFSRLDGAILLQLDQPNPRVDQVRYRPASAGGPAQLLADLGGDNNIYVWDVPQRRYLGALSPGPGSALALEFSGDGHWLAGTSGRDVRVWDANALPPAGWTGPVTPALTLSQEANVTGLALSQDGFWLAVGNAGGTIELWTLPGGQLFSTLSRLGAPAERLAFSPDGRLVASAHADRAIRLWALAGPTTPLVTLTGHSGPITSLAFSPDGRTLASSSWDGTVREWEVGR